MILCFWVIGPVYMEKNKWICDFLSGEIMIGRQDEYLEQNENILNEYAGWVYSGVFKLCY